MTTTNYLGYVIVSFDRNTHHVYRPGNDRTYSAYFSDHLAECLSGAHNWIKEDLAREEQIRAAIDYELETRGSLVR